MHFKRSCGTTNEEYQGVEESLTKEVKKFGEKRRPLRRRLHKKEDEKSLKPEKKKSEAMTHEERKCRFCGRKHVT